MKRIGIILFWVVAALCAKAEDSIPMVSVDTVAVSADSLTVRPNLLKDLRGVEIVQDSALAVLLDEAMNGKGEMIEIDGFRVQIYSSNRQQTAKGEALDLEEKLKSAIDQPVHVLYLPPFWKVRIGDFRTYEEAKEYKKQFVQLYPELMGDTYIVRDKILVLQ